LQARPTDAFNLWLKLFNKDYRHNAKERARRQPIFQQNAALVAEHNQGASSFTMALNEYADLTFEEFAATRLGYNPALASTTSSTTAKLESFMYANVTEVPEAVDWRDAGAVTPVKNQYMCGSCWAFSTTGSIEGINAIKTGKLVSLSEQQLVDCDRVEDQGCGGGLMDNAFEYVLKNGGIDTEADYGYWSFDLPCQHRREEDRPAVTIDGFEDVPVNDPAALKKAVAHQPVSVAICANSGLQFYSSGVYEASSCCTQLNHGVLAVGYADGEGEGNEPHWVVKNSWGSGW
jgi:cathepsin L